MGLVECDPRRFVRNTGKALDGVNPPVVLASRWDGVLHRCLRLRAVVEYPSPVSGIIEKVALLGREFTIQTEYVDGPDARIRTLAYDGGRLVTVRETGVDPSDEADGLIDARIREHHRRITDNLHRRAAELQAAKCVSASPPTPGFPAPTRSTPVAKGRPRPAIEPGSRLEQSITTRQALGCFSLAFARPAPTTAEETETVLTAVESSIDGIMKSPVFDRLRLDEQLTFIAIRGELASWRLSDKDPARAADAWSNVERFSHHLQKINDRRELVAFDHELLTWAMSELGRGSVSDGLIDGLRALVGRDAALDRLLGHPEEMSPHGLLEVLLDLLDRTLV